MPDETALKWQSVLEVLSDSTELSTGKLSIIRMTRVIDVDGTLVLVAGSPFTKSKVEEARAAISRDINDRVRVLGGCYGGLLLGERLAGFKLYLRILGGRGFGGRLGPESRQVEHPVRLAREGISRQGDTTRVAILILGAPIN